MNAKKINHPSVGISFDDANVASISLWAPLAHKVAISINNDIYLELNKSSYGYWHLETIQLLPGDKYVFLLDDKKEYPDPASLFQPDGVTGKSQTVNLKDFNWTDDAWQNTELEAYIFYELHTGTFTPEGNFEGVISKFDHLLSLGITAIEIMPVAQFSGDRNWGYDGVFPFAVQNSYGGPQQLQKLVNACHKKGLAVVLDVVYNHLGPEGNYLPFFGPYFTEKYKTPWGSAINFDDAWCDAVREYYIQNALMWFRDFHIDALRLDAVHAIKDFSPRHILQEMRENIDTLSTSTGKKYHLIVECDLNDIRFINPIPNGFGMDAQWIDEFHHALRVTSGQARTGYYADFDGIADLAKSYRDAYVYDGQYSEQRHKAFGVKTSNAGSQFVVFSQNHDHVGNRMLGERTSALVSFNMQKLMALAVMVSPYLPLLFMGEEWSASSPFQYFVSHSDKDLIAAVQKGRKEEFKAFHNEGETPDPQSPATFERSKLPWQSVNREMLDYYTAIIALRKEQPALSNLNRQNLKVSCDAKKNTLILKRWCDEQELICFMNFSAYSQQISIPQEISGWQQLFETTAGHPALINDSGEITIYPESATIYTLYHV